MKILIISNQRPNSSRSSAPEILYNKLKKEGFNVNEIESIEFVHPSDDACARIFINGCGKTEAYIKKADHFKYGLCYLLKYGKKVGWIETITGIRYKINLSDLK